jgi:hypothetical protein
MAGGFMTNAPIVLFVYNRPKHTAATLAALRGNELAMDSDLFVFSDGAKGEADVPAVAAVRALVQAVTGFRSVTVFEKAHNEGLAASIIAGVSRVIADRGRVVVIEDDIVTSPYFLRYMNAALERYQDVGRVFSVSGYNLPPQIMRFPRGYAHDVYFNPRNSSWGWATWRDRWEKADWNVARYAAFLCDPAAQRAFNQAGDDLTDMLIAEHEGRVHSWAIRWTFTHFLHRAVSVYPVRSYVDNIGLDCSGVHCGWNTALRNDPSRALPGVEFPREVQVVPEVMRAFRRYYFVRAQFRALRRFLLRMFGRAT